MIRTDQTEFSAVDGSTQGNCLSACLSCITEVPIEGIPNFATLHKKTGSWIWDFKLFLQSHDFVFKGTFQISDVSADWPTLLARSPGVRGHFIVSGDSFREHVTAGHATVYYRAGLWHDPHPSRQGLKVVRDAMLIERITSERQL